jgi:hypothetical protein
MAARCAVLGRRAGLLGMATRCAVLGRRAGLLGMAARCAVLGRRAGLCQYSLCSGARFLMIRFQVKSNVQQSCR